MKDIFQKIYVFCHRDLFLVSWLVCSLLGICISVGLIIYAMSGGNIFPSASKNTSPDVSPMPSAAMNSSSNMAPIPSINISPSLTPTPTISTDSSSPSIAPTQATNTESSSEVNNSQSSIQQQNDQIEQRQKEIQQKQNEMDKKIEEAKKDALVKWTCIICHRTVITKASDNPPDNFDGGGCGNAKQLHSWRTD